MDHGKYMEFMELGYALYNSGENISLCLESSGGSSGGGSTKSCEYVSRMGKPEYIRTRWSSSSATPLYAWREDVYSNGSLTCNCLETNYNVYSTECGACNVSCKYDPSKWLDDKIYDLLKDNTSISTKDGCINGICFIDDEVYYVHTGQIHYHLFILRLDLLPKACKTNSLKPHNLARFCRILIEKEPECMEIDDEAGRLRCLNPLIDLTLHFNYTGKKQLGCENLTDFFTSSFCVGQKTRISNPISIAEETGNYSICDRMYYNKNYCYSLVAKATNNYSLCVHELEEVREDCIAAIAASIAEKEKNGVECLKISDKFNRNTCLIKIALETNDPKICGLMNDFRRAGCYTLLATELDNPEVCDSMTDNLEREFCRMKVIL
ncbi:MAG: hypothetical protein ABIH11_06455 [Candidatus Altiarchaeota archaeon]